MALSFFDRLILDTSAYSQMSRQNNSVLDYLAYAQIVYLPTTVIGELEGGFALGRRAAENHSILAEFLDEPFVEVLPPSLNTAKRYGQIFAFLRQAGTPVPTNDIWIAAAALDRGCPVLLSTSTLAVFHSWRA